MLNFDKVIDRLSKFIELKLKIYELKVKEQLVGIISSFAIVALILSFGLIMVLFFSLALGFFFSNIFDSTPMGFGLVGLIYLFICILLIVLKDRMFTNHLFQTFFSETLTKQDDEQDSDQQDTN